ncbi:hypothetical protein [Haloferula sargassicola]|uniref:Uncharacterized protein n=1 Tax=Haloferula sargassicola TaxID=490096 RepID=A0ABP9URH2_9BACT
MNDGVPSDSEARERELDKLEDEFPQLADAAFFAEAERTLAAGLTLTQAFDGQVVRISPDGRCEVVKTIHPPHPVEVGRRIWIW